MVKTTQEATTQVILATHTLLWKVHSKFSNVVHPLNELLQKMVMVKTPMKLSLVKQLLSKAPISGHFDPKLPLCLAGDASVYWIGVVIYHR